MAHIPDGFLSAPVAATTLVGAGVVAACAARRTRDGLSESAAPVLGLTTAAMFAAQMVNFPIAAGTSGHLLGGVLAAVLLGPWAAYLVVLAVLIGQAILFGDGGLTALGANALNIGGCGALAGYALYRVLVGLTGGSPACRALSAAVAAYPVTVLTGAAVGVELGLSGVAPLELSIGAMAGLHAVLAIAEASITGLVVYSLAQRRPELIHRTASVGADVEKPAILLALGLSAVVAGLLSILASTGPDALERTAIDLGFADAARQLVGAPFDAYSALLPGPAGTAVAGLLGVILTFAGTVAIARAATGARVGRRRSS